MTFVSDYSVELVIHPYRRDNGTIGWKMHFWRVKLEDDHLIEAFTMIDKGPWLTGSSDGSIVEVDVSDLEEINVPDYIIELLQRSKVLNDS